MKTFQTFRRRDDGHEFDSLSAVLFDKIYVSAGQRGVQVILNPETLAQYIGADFADLTKS